MAMKAKRLQYTFDRPVKRAKKPKPPRRDVPVDTAQPGTSASDRRAGGDSTARRNRSARAAKKSEVVLEDSKGARPSRKSTRRSKNAGKFPSNLERRQIRAVSAPKQRAARAKARSR